MTPAAADALVRVYRCLTEIGMAPTNAEVFALVRKAGHRVGDAEGKRLLAEERLRAHAPEPRLDLRGPAPELPLPAPATRTRPRITKESSNPVSYVQGELVSEPTAQTVKPERKDPRTADERVADDAIGLLRPRIEPLLSGMTWSTWRTRNRRAVVDMVKAGMSPTEIDAAHDRIRDAAGQPFVTMAWFQNRLASRRPTPPPAPFHSDEFERSPHAAGAQPAWGEPVNRPLR